MSFTPLPDPRSNKLQHRQTKTEKNRVQKIGDDGSEKVEPPAATLDDNDKRTLRKIRRNTRIFRAIVAVLSVVAVLAMIGVVVASLFDLNGAAFYRSAWLCLHGIFAMTAISAVTDEDFFDFVTAIVAGNLAIFTDVFLAVIELTRHYGCPLPGTTPLDVSICINSPGLSAVLPWVALLLFLLALAAVILLFVWLSYHTVSVELRKRLAEQSREKLGKSLLTWRGAFRAIVAVLLLVAVLLVVIVNMRYPYGAAFYHGAFMIIPAHLTGCLFAYFAHTPGWWKILTIIFGVLSTASAVLGAIFDWPRYLRCWNGDPITLQVEQIICADESWRGAILPWTLIVVAALSVLAIIAVALSPSNPAPAPSAEEEALLEPEN